MTNINNTATTHSKASIATISIIAVVLIALVMVCVPFYRLLGSPGWALPWASSQEATVTVTVEDSDGKPISGCTCDFTPQDGKAHTLESYISNKQGKFASYASPLGDVDVDVSCTPQRSRVTQTRQVRTSIHLSHSGESQHITVTIPD